jgi:mono/diheme cytochrome c family protein
MNSHRVLRTFLYGGLLAASLTGSVTPAADLVAKSGRELYEQLCASCHGVNGRGDGPVARSLTVEVPDLTRFAMRRGGSFDRALVERVIDGRQVIGAHGSRSMPVWGEDLSLNEVGNPDAERATRIIIERIADYVSQLQRATAKAPHPKRD